MHVTADDFRALVGRSSQMEPKLKAALRRRLRDAGEAAAGDVRAALGSGAGGGLRSKITVRVSIAAAGKGAGVRIVASGPMAQAWESSSGWKHPVYGNRGTWVKQTGNPYFRKIIHSRRDQVKTAVEDALREALESL